MKKHPLFRRIAVSYRFPQYVVDAIDKEHGLYVVDAIDKEHGLTDDDKTEIVQLGVVKLLKIKKPRLKE